jgi:hypothetical protein
MKRAIGAATLATLLHATVGFGAESGLEARVTHADGWVAWTVPMIADAGEPCCFSGNGHGYMRGGCDLDGNARRNTSGRARPLFLQWDAIWRRARFGPVV